MTVKRASSFKDGVVQENLTHKNRVDSVLVNRAVAALLKHHEEATSNDKQLLGTDRIVQVQIGLDRVPQNPSPKPIRVMIPNPIHLVKTDDDSDDDHQGLEQPEVCLIVKEESKPWVQEMISNFPEHMGCIKKVLGLQSLRRKYKQFEQRRELLQKFDLFLADDRILPMLAKCLGKNFFKTKKQPIPIRLTRKEALPLAVRSCLSATFMYMSAGTCLTIRAGNTGMTCAKLVENVEAIAANAVSRVPRKWANVRSVSIKTSESVALPIYNKTPEELLEISKMAGIPQDTAKDEEVNETKHEVEIKSKKRKQELASKSPLIRALKKKKDSDNKESRKTNNNKKTKPRKDEAKMPNDSLKKPDKRERKQQSVAEAAPLKKEKKAQGPAKKKTTLDDGPVAEKKQFILSKKFVGSKPGYVFRKGAEGLGYYVDVKPVPDKMAMAALARLASSPGRRKSSGGKRRGRR